MYPTILVGVCARVRGEGRELPGVGALATFLCRWVCHEVRVPMGDSPGCGVGLALGTSCDKFIQHSWNILVAISPRYFIYVIT